MIHIKKKLCIRTKQFMFSHSFKIQQAQQQQQQQADAQQAFAYQQPEYDNRAAAQFTQFQPQSAKYQQQQAATNNLLGTHFSPSNEVSHVKFSSGDSSYNF